MTSETCAVCSRCNQLLPVAAKKWAFIVPLEPPSQNVVAGNKGGGRHKYKEIRDNYRMLFRNKMNTIGIPRATDKRRVLVTRLYSGRGKKRDFGNLVGGCKPLLDALTLEGLIIDDKDSCLEDHYYQERREESGVRIVLEEGFEWSRAQEQ